MQLRVQHLITNLTSLVGLLVLSSIPFTSAQSSQAAAEWGLFNQILVIGIIVGIVVFGLLFYAIIRFREKPKKTGAT